MQSVEATSEATTVRIQDWVTRSFPVARRREIGLHDRLLEEGIIDSMGTLEVVQFLEEEFGIRLTDEDMLADHFESIAAIASFVDTRRRGAEAG